MMVFLPSVNSFDKIIIKRMIHAITITMKLIIRDVLNEIDNPITAITMQMINSAIKYNNDTSIVGWRLKTPLAPTGLKLYITPQYNKLENGG